MEPLTLLAAGATVILTGALTRVGELTLDGTIAQLQRLIAAKSPETLQRLQSADLGEETIEIMATLIEEDAEIRAVAEQVVQENQNKPYVINQMKNVGIVNQGGTINYPVFNFN